MFKRGLIALTATLVLILAAHPARAEDRHEGYYYPPVGASTETYEPRAKVLAEASRAVRIGFVTELTRQQFAAPYPPQYAIFAKGEDAEKLIIVALDDEVFRTLFRARGVLAQLTAHARTTEFFKANSVDDYFTFFDLCRLLGFAQLTISDGQTWSHRVEFAATAAEVPAATPEGTPATPTP
jgi:hypothetical protein